jgi:ribosomal protein L18E
MMASQNLGNPSMENLTVENLSNSTQIVSNDLFMNIAKDMADRVWANSRNIRDCLRVGRIAKSAADTQFLIDNFLNYNNH